jgi:hypothetical protein
MEEPRASNTSRIAQPTRWRLAFRILLIVLIGASIAAIMLLPSEHQPWKPLRNPSEKAIAILVYEYPDLYVGTATSAIYACRDSIDCRLVDRDELTDAIREVDSEYCQLDLGTPPEPPGRVVDTLELDSCGVDTAVQIHFVLLDDGTLWQWWKFADDEPSPWQWIEELIELVSPF